MVAYLLEVRGGTKVGPVIAKVEPLTPARSLRGPFDYLLGAGARGRRGRQHARRPLRAAAAAGRRRRPRQRERRAGGAARRAAVGARGRRARDARAARAVGRPRVRVHARARPGAGAAARHGHRRGSAAASRAARCGQRSRDEGRAALDGEAVRLGRAPARGARGARRPGRRARPPWRGCAGADHSTLRSLERRGLVSLEQAADAPRRPRIEGVGARAGGVEPTAAQQAALEAIARRIEAPERPLLLHGVTGSGKTEVYLRAVAAALERGRSAIVLVPEIALTPQTAGRFVERFGDAVAIMHSQLSQRERYDEWWRMRRGEARVCVGPRSAVFAPFDDLGLIVVDEEHDSSYKQEGDPRYDARVVAERRAALEGALLVAGSATPRPESLVRYERVELRERVDGRRLPPVEIVGMAGVSGPLHERTRQELDGVRRRGEKAIVLLNRRGWSNFLSCRLCGRVWECPDCDVTLVLHQAAAELACHHCGHRASRAARLPGLRLGVGGAPRRRHRAARARAGAARRAAAGVPARLGRGRRLGHRRGAARVRGGRGGRAGRHADGRQGPRLPRRDARRGARRGRHAALPRLPRRGAHVRAGRPARRPQRSRRARRARDRAGARARRRAPSATPRRTTRAASSPTSCRAARRSPTRPTGT